MFWNVTSVLFFKFYFSQILYRWRIWIKWFKQNVTIFQNLHVKLYTYQSVIYPCINLTLWHMLRKVSVLLTFCLLRHSKQTMHGYVNTLVVELDSSLLVIPVSLLWVGLSTIDVINQTESQSGVQQPHMLMDICLQQAVTLTLCVLHCQGKNKGQS